MADQDQNSITSSVPVSPSNYASVRNAMYRWAFTISFTKVDREQEIIKVLDTHCKKWAFQKEKSDESEYLHWQGRFSLKKKMRRSQVKALFGSWMPHLSIESDERASFNYVLKDDTRVDGPWTDQDVTHYMPSHLRIEEWNPFQRLVLERIEALTPRSILFVVDMRGCRGKSTLALRMSAQRKADILPPMLTTANDMLHWAFAKLKDRRSRKPIFIDLPRGYSQDYWGKFISALECIANGYAYDERYQFKDCFFESPQIVVFCNSIPDTLQNLLTNDRIETLEFE